MRFRLPQPTPLGQDADAQTTAPSRERHLDTAVDGGQVEAPTAHTTQPEGVTWACGSIQGSRAENQDRVYADSCLLAVMDGVHGAAHGAQGAAVALAALLTESAYQQVGGTVNVPKLLHEMNHAVIAFSEKVGRRSATTAVFAMVSQTTDGRRYMQVGAAGDSSAFLVRGGRMRSLTSPAEEQVIANQLVDWIGNPDFSGGEHHAISVSPGDRVLLVTDGVTGSVSRDELGTLVMTAASPQSAVDSVITLCRDRNTSDNASIACAFLGLPEALSMAYRSRTADTSAVTHPTQPPTAALAAGTPQVRHSEPTTRPGLEP